MKLDIAITAANLGISEGELRRDVLGRMLPREDLRLACAPDRAQAVHARRHHEEVERARWAQEMRERERQEVLGIHEAAVEKRVDALKRGEFVPLPGRETPYVPPLPSLGYYGASGYRC